MVAGGVQLSGIAHAMKRFLLFYNECYYPSGGWDDFKGSFNTEAEAVGAFTEFVAQKYEEECEGQRGIGRAPFRDLAAFSRNWWMHIVDATTGEMVVGKTRLSQD